MSEILLGTNPSNPEVVGSYKYEATAEEKAKQLPEPRGYRILCADTKFTNNADGYGGYEDHVPAIKAAVEYVRKIAGVTKVVLVGHSMGAPMMAFYQNVAQNGPAACQRPERLQPCPSAGLANLPAADGLILLDPHLGDAVATLTYVDPAIGDEGAPAARDKQLDMFDPSNGFDPSKNAASYSPAFRAAYLAAQAQRNTRLIVAAVRRLALIEMRDLSVYADDMPFIVAGANAARRRVDDALEGRVVVALRGQAHVGERVLDLLPVVEAGTAHDPVRDVGLPQRLLHRARLRVGPVEDRGVAQRPALPHDARDLAHDVARLAALVGALHHANLLTRAEIDEGHGHTVHLAETLTRRGLLDELHDAARSALVETVERIVAEATG